MPKVSTNISLDSDLKRESQLLLSDLGLDLSTAVTIFLKQTVREQGIPFAVSRITPNAETAAAMRECEEIKAHPETCRQYDSFGELLSDVLADE